QADHKNVYGGWGLKVRPMKSWQIVAAKCIAAGALVLLFVAQTFFRDNIIKMGVFALMFVVFAAAYIVVGLMKARARADHQRVRNRSARVLMSRVRANKPIEEDFVLFLRPFDDKGKHFYVDLEQPPEGNFSFEIYVTDALERKMQVICVS